MKKKVLPFVLSLFIVCTLSKSVFAQTIDWNCVDVLTNYSSQVPLTISCNRTSSTFTNKFSKIETFLPSVNDNDKIIRVNFVIFQDANGNGNFQDNPFDRIRLINIFNWLRGRFLSNTYPSDPIAGVVDYQRKYVDFKLSNIYFEPNAPYMTTDLFTALNWTLTNVPGSRTAINIMFSQGGSGFAKATRGSSYNRQLDLGVLMLGVYNGGVTGSDFASASTMGHEVCHTLDLCHTYAKPNVGCYSTLAGMGTDPDNGDYFPDLFGSPYPGNAPHFSTGQGPNNPGWAYDVYINPIDRITNNMLSGFRDEEYLSPLQIAKIHRALAMKTPQKYIDNCVYNTTPYVCSSNEVWDFDIVWDRDIIIANGATLDLNCRLSMPQNSSIDVQSGAILTIDGVISNNCDNAWNGTIHVEAGGTIHLLGNADITFAGNGKILVDDDPVNPGKIIYDQGAKVYLNSPNSSIEINGILELTNNAELTLDYQTNNHGYFKFGKATQFPSRNIIAGTNCKINLQGSSISRKILEIDQETFYAPASLIDFILSNGKVEFATDSRLQADGLSTNINFNNVRFTSNTPGQNNLHRGVHLYGQPSINISNCIFEYGKYGIYGFQTFGGAPLNVNHCIFRNNTTGMMIFDKGVNLLNCNFFRNNNAFIGNGMQFPSGMSQGVMGGNLSAANDFGITWFGTSPSTLNLDNPMITYNTQFGIRNYNSALMVKCGLISNNQTGIFVGNPGGSLHMDDQVNAPDFANVSVTNNDNSISVSRADYLYLFKGENNLQPKTLGNGRTVSGTLTRLPYQIAADNNWFGSSGLNASDFNVIDLNNNPYTFIAQTTLPNPVPCGQAVPPCNPCDLNSPIVYCPDCDVLNTDNFDNKKLNEATQIVLTKLKSNEQNKYSESIDLFYDILMKNYSNPDDKEKYLLNYNYLKMMDALGNAYRIQELDCSTGINSKIEKIIEIQSKFIDEAMMSGNYINRFKYSFDRAETYRIACEPETALEKLNSMLDWINDSEDEKTVNSLRCQVSLEVDIEHNLIEMGDIEQLASQCLNGEINTARIASNNAGMQKRVSLSISVSPNPASTFVTITTDSELALLTILDPFGKVVFSKEINYDLVIDVSIIAKGVYSLQIKDAYGNRSTAKLVIS